MCKYACVHAYTYAHAVLRLGVEMNKNKNNLRAWGLEENAFRTAERI